MYCEKQINPEGTPFAQRVVDSNKKLPLYDLKCWENMPRFICLKKCQPVSRCTKKIPILTVMNKLMTENLSQVNQVGPPELRMQQVYLSFAILRLKSKKAFMTLTLELKR